MPFAKFLLGRSQNAANLSWFSANVVNVRRLYLLAFIHICINSAASFATELSDQEAALQRIVSELESLQSEVVSRQEEASKERAALKSIDIELGVLARNLGRLEVSISNTEGNLADLAAQQVALQRQAEALQGKIQDVIELAYKQNNQPLLKVLFSGQRPEEISRNLYYFSALTENQQAKLADWVTVQNQIAENVDAETQLLTRLQEEKTEVQRDSQAMQEQMNRRAQALVLLEQSEADAAAEIVRLDNERSEKEQIIEDLRIRLNSLALELPGQTPILERRGALNWPVEGSLVNRFGARIDGQRVNWEGWLIAADAGTPVKAVHGGRVVFADYFKSHGLLMILDHGNDIWTLYGRNQTLLKDVGTWVNAGELIAEVGQSGGYNQSRLYFEVRRLGEPENPAGWLASN